MINIIFIITFLVSIFCFSKECVDWCIIPNTVILISFLAIISILLVCKREKLFITIWFVISLIITVILYIIGEKNCYSQYTLLAGILSFFLFFVKNMDNRFFNEKQLARVFPLFLVFEAIFGIVQFIQTGETTQVKGHFDNSLGFAMALSFSIPFLLYTIKNDSKFFARSAIVVLGVIFIVLLISTSRSVLFASGLLILLYNSRIIWNYWKRCRGIVRIIFFVLVVFVIFISYWLKQDSANGRLLIWGTAFSMLWDQPWGYGLGGVAREYMNSQAVFLSGIRNSYWVNLSDNLNRVFSEYLAIGIEFGIVCMLFVFGGFLYIIRCILLEQDEKRKLFQALLFIVFFISLFSYPLYYPVSWVIIGYAICRLVRGDRYMLSVRPVFVVRCCLIISLAIVVFYQRDRLYDQKQWCSCARKALNGDVSVLEKEYPLLYTKLKGYPMFLYNYGAELHYAGKYDLSCDVLDEYLQQVADYDAWLLLADNYYGQDRYSRAIDALKRAEKMCPGRFFPLYKQMLIYQRMGNKRECVQMANRILDKKVKIPSTDIEQMKQEALCILEKEELSLNECLRDTIEYNYNGL